MKKVFLAVLAAALFGLSGCNNLEVSSEASVASERKTVLENLMKTGNYKVSEEEVLKTLDSFLEKSSESRSAKAGSYSMVGKRQLSANFAGTERSAATDSVELKAYELNGNGFALTSNDRRIGLLLAVVSDGDYETAENVEFWNFYNELLEEYVNDTAELWNEVIVENSRSLAEDIVSSGDYTFENYKFRSGNTDSILSTKWSQSGIFNDAIEAVYGVNYLAGCGCIGTSQVIAFNEPEVKMADEYYNKVMASWPEASASGWDGTYDWKLIKSANPTGLAYIQLASFIYEVAERCKASYGISNTSTYASNCASAMKKYNLEHDGLMAYNYEKVVESIDNGCPIAMRGANSSSGHFFDLDGYADLIVDARNNQTGELIMFEDKFVHVNPGWGGSQNGYYLSGVFDMRYGSYHINDRALTSEEDSGIEYNAEYTFSRDVRIIPNIHYVPQDLPESVEMTLESFINPGFGYAVYFAGDFKESDTYQKAVRGTFENGKWILKAKFADSKKTDYSVYVGKYDLGKTVQGTFEGLEWTEGENVSQTFYSNTSTLYSNKNPGYGYAVYFAGSFDEGRNWTKAIRGSYNYNDWILQISGEEDTDFEYKALIGSYDLGEEVEYSYPGLIKQ